jgi:hypothetical protein
LNQANKSLNHFIAILAVIALIGILFIPAVSAGKFLNYGPVQGPIKTIPAVKYVQAPSSFVPYLEQTLTTLDNATLIPDIPAIDKTHDLSTDLLLLLYPENRHAGYNESEVRSLMIVKRVLIPGDRLVSGGQTVGDIVHVQVTIKPETRAEAETYFYSILGYSFGDQITIEGWLPLNIVKELEAFEGVIAIDLVWPPVINSASVNSPGISAIIPSSLIKPAIVPSQSISKLPQTGVTSSGASRFSQYVK